MCGICGIFNYGNSAVPVTTALVSRMRDTMVFRGPDDAGVWVSPDGAVGLGHRRLSIVDLSPAGHQPMSNEAGDVWLAYNGEAYNHEELRPALEAAGHVYRGRSDTETIVHLYEEHGADMLPMLAGMWGLALWDAPRRQMLLARDRLGIKPLYYTLANGRLIFASEIRAILAHPAVSADVDPAALTHFLTFLNTPAPETLFAGIRKLPPATALVCDAAGNVRTWTYWDPLDAKVPVCTPDEYAEQIRALLSDSVRQLMMSDVPVGAFLSGGIDSSTNVALMSRHTDRPVNTVSIRFEGFGVERNFHDMPYARQVAEQFGTHHSELVIDTPDFTRYVSDFMREADEPLCDPASVPLRFISRHTKELGITVVLVGEGSDEVWCGYPQYVDIARIHQRKWRLLRALPGPMRTALYRASRLAPGRGRRDVLRRAARGEEMFWGLEIGFWDAEQEPLIAGELKEARRRSPAGTVVADIMRPFDQRRPDADYLARMTWLELQNRLPELLLLRIDRVTMASSLEARPPFLDHRLVELGVNLPASVKAPGGRAKDLLKRALRGVIPDNILDRPKQGFRVPLPEWFRDTLAGRVRGYLLGSPMRERGFFDYGHIAALVDAHTAGRADYSYKMWSLVNLTAWYDRWIAHADRSL